MMRKSVVWGNYLLLLGIGVIWGSQFVFNEIALRSLPPLTIAAVRIVIGMFTLYILAGLFSRGGAAVTSSAVPTRKLWVDYAVISFFEAILPFFLVVWGQRQVDSSIAAILLGTIPIFTLVFTRSFVRDEAWTGAVVLSVLLGFLGVIVLLAPNVHGAAPSSLWGELAILGGAMSFAIGIILLKKLPAVSAIKSVRNIFFIAALPMVVLAFWVDRPWQLEFTWSAALALLVLGVFCAGIVYLMYLVLIHRAGSTFASLTNYLVPVVGVIIGVIFAGEHMSGHEWLALVMILAALGIYQFKRGGA